MMKPKYARFPAVWGTVIGIAITATGAGAEDALIRKTVEEAFPGPKSVEVRPLTLSSSRTTRQRKRISSTPVRSAREYYAVATNDITAGYALVHTAQGKHGPIRLLVVTASDLSVLRTEILQFRERRGHAVRGRRFLAQFTGKSPDDPIALRVDIDAITGATISSRAVTRGVREALRILRDLIDKRPSPG